MKKKIRVDKIRRWRARRSRVSSSLARTKHTRLTVYRSARHIYAQLIDPSTGSTIASASTRSTAIKGDLPGTGNVEAAKRVGTAIAGIAREKGIESVVFNRNGYLYHGRVKALAEAAREAGLQF